MRVFIDIESDTMVRSLGTPQVVNAIRFKRTELVRLEVQFFRNGQVVEFDETALGVFELKPVGQYDAEPLTGGSAWNKVSTGLNTFYFFTFTLVNSALDALFFVDGNPNNDVAVVPLMGEIQWTVDGGIHKTQTLTVSIDNDVIRVGDTIVGGGASPDYLIDDTDPANPQFVIDDDTLIAISDG